MKFDGKFWGAVAILIGTIVGAGIFGLPYATAKIGFLGGIFYLILATSLVLITHHCYAEVVLRTDESMQMSGYAQKYLGSWGRIIITVSLILGIYSAMIAYTIGVGNFLYELFSPYLGGSSILYSVLFWIAGSLAILFGLKLVSKIELLLSAFLVILVFVIFFTALPKIDASNLSYFSFKNIFFPYTIFLFAASGVSIIPVINEQLGDKKLLKKIILIGTIIPAIIYFLFILSVVGVSGHSTTEQAIDGLNKFLGNKIFIIGAFLGIITMTTSFISIGYCLKDLFEKDYKFSKILAWALTCFIPIILFLLGLRSFIEIISIGGGFFAGFDGILILTMFYRAKRYGDRQPEFVFNLSKFLAIIIALLLFFGIVYNFINLTL